MEKKYITPVINVKVINGMSLLSGSTNKVTETGNTIILGDDNVEEGDAGEAASKGVNYIW